MDPNEQDDVLIERESVIEDLDKNPTLHFVEYVEKHNLNSSQEIPKQQIIIEVPPELKKLLNSDKFVHCPNKTCGNIFENAGPGNEREFASELVNGQPLTNEALKHRAAFRFKCRECSEEFCSKCFAQPYHLGFSCDDFRKRSRLPPCLFCKAPATSEEEPVCVSEKCVSKRHDSCFLTLPCSHRCRSSSHSGGCPPCIHPNCSPVVSQNADEFCSICWVEELGALPVAHLECGHIFHVDCLQTQLRTKWPGNAVSVSYTECPLCNKPITSPVYKLQDDSSRATQLRQDVELRCNAQIKIEKMEDTLKAPGPYCNDVLHFGLSKFNFYECHQCKSLYYGGSRLCGEDPVENLQKADFTCGGCRGCAVHGLEGITFKCRHCCAVADWFCFGHTHFCTPCHNRAWDIHNMNNQQYLKIEIKICPGKDNCPLGVEHPPHGEEFILKGCSFCGVEEPKPAVEVPKAEPKKEEAKKEEKPVPKDPEEDIEREEEDDDIQLGEDIFDEDKIQNEAEEKKDAKSFGERIRSFLRVRW